MKITRETDYAIRCILHMARETGRLHMITDIAKKQDMPKSFVAKILQKLAKAKIVSSTRGVNGGFALRKKPSEITLLHLIEAVQGPIFINSCVVDNKSCSRRSLCSVHPVWIEIRNILRDKLKEYDFQKLLKNRSGYLILRESKVFGGA